MSSKLFVLPLLLLLNNCGSQTSRPTHPGFVGVHPTDRSKTESKATDASSKTEAKSNPSGVNLDVTRPSRGTGFSSVDVSEANSIAFQQQEMTKEFSEALSAFMGKSAELKGVQLHGHNWNIKAADISKEGDLITISGQISHAIAFTVDDQIFYKLEIRNSFVEKFDIKVDRRNWMSIARLALPLAESKLQLPVTFKDVESFTRKADASVYKDWEDQAKIIILRLGIFAAKNL